MLTTSKVFKVEVAKLLAKAIEEQTEVVTGPYTVVDFPAYKYHVGMIAGLRFALEVLDEAETAVQKRERGE